MNTVFLNQIPAYKVARLEPGRLCAFAPLRENLLINSQTPMPKRIITLLLLFLVTGVATAQKRIPTPAEVLGFAPGEDRKLASWDQVVDYFQKLDAASDRVVFETLGNTTMGKPFVMATISSPANLARLEEFKKIQDQLADPR
jgi:hypothetical protein